jgi:hypothetical protein
VLDLELGPVAEAIARDDLEVEAQRLGDHLAQAAQLHRDHLDPATSGVAHGRVDDRARDRELVHQLAGLAGVAASA